MNHWSEKYVGMPYIEDEFDCGHLAEQVQRDEFCRDVQLPKAHACGRRNQTAQIRSLLNDYGTRTETPQDGDGVVLISRASLSHIGVYCIINGAGYVLHNMRKANVVLHRLRDLPLHSLTVEGYYAWKI